MFTYYLSAEQVDAYCKDLMFRLEALGNDFPLIWCTLGQSGAVIGTALSRFVSEKHREDVKIVTLRFDRDKKEICFTDEGEKEVFSKGGSVLLLDSSVHSGSTMLAAFNSIAKLSAGKICSYSLVLKCGSSFVPNFFGLLMQEHDRAYFLLDRIPNHRVAPFGVIRKLNHEDVDRAKFTSGLDSLDKITWADLWYEVQTKHSQVFVYENKGEILGFISFIIKDSHLFVDAVACAKAAQGQKIAPNLFRWAESSARVANCRGLHLWAIDNRVKWYEGLGFQATAREMRLGSERFVQMERALLYNLKSTQTISND